MVVEYPGWTDEPLNFYLRSDSSIRALNPPEEADIRPLIRNAGRIWLVRSYRPYSAESERLLLAALAETHVADSVIRVNDGLIRNPWAVHVAEISITCYRPKAGL